MEISSGEVGRDRRRADVLSGRSAVGWELNRKENGGRISDEVGWMSGRFAKARIGELLSASVMRCPSYSVGSEPRSGRSASRAIGELSGVERSGKAANAKLGESIVSQLIQHR